MAITTISAQSSFAVGAILNATFGSMVEVILFIIMLKKGKEEGETCYMELVKSTLTGSILCCILLVPGLSMVTGGLKYRRQKFNPRSANISSSLLFVAIMGVFAPTIFSKIYGNLECEQCQTLHTNSTETNGTDTGFLCSGCKTVTIGPDNDKSLHWAHVEPLMYTCAIILPLSYLIGLVFFMKTHSTDIFAEFEQLQQEEGNRYLLLFLLE
ncbi:low affinity vacuolar monovalent cation/H(+) antiporter-like [Elysia marginata]|uniref:Low affinity vacuolar monovalent cation/H(+) antiporter-like n=1 Tax=Elysia marginata TaxID=1093978 RepID=A0AAV4GTQ2_9GAST|nr:low affinity vacuolar monovalent cation/H(+) antiporter-like [Elysia marginata]